jgi:hypothetical protein
MEPAIDDRILEFVDLLEKKYLSTSQEYRAVDLARKLQYLTLDIITTLAFGKKFGYIETDSDVYEYIKMTEDSMPVMMVLTVFPGLAKILQSPLVRGIMPSERDRVGFGKFIGYEHDLRSFDERAPNIPAALRSRSSPRGSRRLPPKRN